MLRRGVVRHEVHQDADAEPVCPPHECLEVAVRSHCRVEHVEHEVVGDGVAEVAGRRGVDRRQPERGDAEAMEMRQVLGDAAQPARPEAARNHPVNDGSVYPFRASQRQPFLSGNRSATQSAVSEWILTPCFLAARMTRFLIASTSSLSYLAALSLWLQYAPQYTTDPHRPEQPTDRSGFNGVIVGRLQPVLKWLSGSGRVEWDCQPDSQGRVREQNHYHPRPGSQVKPES